MTFSGLSAPMQSVQLHEVGTYWVAIRMSGDVTIQDGGILTAKPAAPLEAFQVALARSAKTAPAAEWCALLW